MKVGSAEIIASSGIKAELLGEFVASLHSANFEFSRRSYIGAEEDFKGDPDDPRKDKHHKAIDDFSVSHEESGFESSQGYVEKMAGAKATEYARKIANVRGSEADPDYMEARIRELVEGKSRVAETRVLRGQ